MLHVAVNAHLLSPVGNYRQAGISGYIDQLLRHLWRAADDVRWTVYVPPGVSRETMEAPEHVRLVQSRLPTTHPVARIIWEQCVAPATLLRDRPDVLFCPLNVVPLLAPCPMVVTMHDLAFIRYRLHRATRAAYLKILTRLSARRAAHVITGGEFARREVLNVLHVPPSHVTSIPHGRDPRFSPPDSEAVERFRKAKKLPPRYLLFVGTLEPRKNLATLLRAFAAARPRLKCPLVVVGGKGWHFDHLFQLVTELRLEADVHFTGFVDRDELPLYYAAALAFIYPSLYEGFGLPPLEAMASGTPAIVSDAGAVQEVVGDAAVVVPALDVAALAEALVRVNEDPALCAALRRRGLERAKQFDWAVAARSTLNVLRAAAGVSGPGVVRPMMIAPAVAAPTAATLAPSST